jgi:hypothetical protein
MEDLMKNLFLLISLFLLPGCLFGLVYIGDLNTNKFDPNSVHNQFGTYGNPYSPLSINNKFGKYGSEFSIYSANNPYTLQAPKLFDVNGVYLGKLSANKFDIESISNPVSIYKNMVLQRYNTIVIRIYGQG